MELCLFEKERQHTIYQDVLQLLQEADQEFVPPLSSRSSATQQDFSGVSENSNGVLSYFEQLKQQRFIGALENGKLLGFVSFRENYQCREIPPEELPNIYISTLIVRPEARGKGVTTALYDRLFTEYRNSNIFTRTWSTNLAHTKILGKYGFNLFRSLPNDRGNGIDTVYFKKAKKQNP